MFRKKFSVMMVAAALTLNGTIAFAEQEATTTATEEVATQEAKDEITDAERMTELVKGLFSQDVAGYDVSVLYSENNTSYNGFASFKKLHSDIDEMDITINKIDEEKNSSINLAKFNDIAKRVEGDIYFNLFELFDEFSNMTDLVDIALFSEDWLDTGYEKFVGEDFVTGTVIPALEAVDFGEDVYDLDFGYQVVINKDNYDKIFKNTFETIMDENALGEIQSFLRNPINLGMNILAGSAAFESKDDLFVIPDEGEESKADEMYQKVIDLLKSVPEQIAEGNASIIISLQGYQDSYLMDFYVGVEDEEMPKEISLVVTSVPINVYEAEKPENVLAGDDVDYYQDVINITYDRLTAEEDYTEEVELETFDHSDYDKSEIFNDGKFQVTEYNRNTDGVTVEVEYDDTKAQGIEDNSNKEFIHLYFENMELNEYISVYALDGKDAMFQDKIDKYDANAEVRTRKFNGYDVEYLIVNRDETHKDLYWAVKISDAAYLSGEINGFGDVTDNNLLSTIRYTIKAIEVK